MASAEPSILVMPTTNASSLTTPGPGAAAPDFPDVTASAAAKLIVCWAMPPAAMVTVVVLGDRPVRNASTCAVPAGTPASR